MYIPEQPSFLVDKLDLLSSYPEYVGKKVDIQRYTIFPIDIQSNHKGEKVTFTEKAAIDFLNQMRGTPLLYADNGKKLPKTHTDKNGEREVVGTVIGGGMFNEAGIKWVYADCIIYRDINEDIYNTIMNNIALVGTSIEASVSVDDQGFIYEGTFNGLSIVENKNTAWKTKVLVADKGDEELEIRYDDILKQIVGASLEDKIKERVTEITAQKSEVETKLQELETILKEKEDVISGLKEENKSLQELNTSFSKLF